MNKKTNQNQSPVTSNKTNGGNEPSDTLIVEAVSKPVAPVNDKVLKVSKEHGSSVKKEINGPKGLEPTRYGDWESKGRCYDF